MKYLIICAVLFVVTSANAYQTKKSKSEKDTVETFMGLQLKPDTSKYPGVKGTLTDSSGGIYFKMIVAPQSGGFYVTENNIVLLPIAGGDLTPAKLNVLISELQAIKADAAVERARSEADKEKKK
jgi:hypothetical protein